MPLFLLHVFLNAALIVVTLPSLLNAADFSGPVISILDGDTIEVLHNNRAERIRLNGIDCPEKGQAYGQKAKEAVADLVFGKEVTLQTYGLDKYGRTIGDVLLSDRTNVNYELVKDGWCWWYRKYAPRSMVLEKYEKDARDSKKGLWADPAPVPPWVYRKARRGQSLDLSDLVPLDNETTYSGFPRGPPTDGAAKQDFLAPQKALSGYPIMGNRRSHIYHRVDCPNYSQVAPKNRVSFSSAAEAEEAGYRVARNCP
jgi:micrococcal nuclease